MGIRFAYPLTLLLLLPLGFLLWKWWRGPNPVTPGRRKVILAVRAIVFTCLVLSLAGTELNLPVRDQTVVFVVDASASVGAAREGVENWIRSALEHKSRDDRGAVVTFGREAYVDQSPGKEQNFNHLEAVVDPNHSNPAAGLRLAGALLPPDTRKRVVLFTDGRENLGDSYREAALLAAQGARVDVVPLRTEAGPEVLADSLEAPGSAFKGEQIEIKAGVNSTIKTVATLRVYEGRSLVSEQRVSLNPGPNEFAFQVTAERTGFQTYRTAVEADSDTMQANNEAAAVTHVLGPPRVLIVAGKEAEGRNLTRALGATGLEAEVRTVGEIPQTLAELRQFSGLVLADVPAVALGDRVMAGIESYVRDLGQGLIMTGGEDSFGVGGYFRTPVEAALPVYMDLRGKAKVPSLGLVLIVDKSGSMTEGAGGVSKVDLAKEAAAQAAEILSPRDSIGVVAFDEESKWVVKTRKVTDVEKIQDAIGTIRADGGTNIYPSLEMAYESLLKTEAKLKHIILLTDGMSATAGDYEALAARMRKAKITLSAVGVGNDADTTLLSMLAQAGGGRFYFTNDLPSIPKIFTKETILATRTYLVNHRFAPYLGAPSPIINSLSGKAVPLLEGYVATSPKEAAEMVLLSDKGDPVLAQWQYGLGRSAAWTSDLGGRWSASWTGAGFGRFWSDLVAWTIPRSDTDAMSVQASVEAGEGRIKVETPPNAKGVPDTRATIIDPRMGRKEIRLTPSSPGWYTGRFPASEPGTYLVEVSQWQNGEPVAKATSGVVVPYSPEFRAMGTDDGFLKGLARAGKGAVISQPAQAFARNLGPVRGSVGLWRLLLLLAIILLPFDIAVRRLMFGPGDITALITKLRERITWRGPHAGEHNPLTARLQKRKEQTAARRDALARATGYQAGASPRGEGVRPGGGPELVPGSTGSKLIVGQHSGAGTSDRTIPAANFRSSVQPKPVVDSRPAPEAKRPVAEPTAGVKPAAGANAKLSSDAESQRHTSKLLEAKRRMKK